MNIEKARSEDVAEVVEILSSAARWLRERGIDQWPDPFPRGRVDEAFERDELYAAWIDGQMAATFTLQWEDELFWGPQPPLAGYIHAVAVRREHAGLGRELVAWAAEAVRSAGRPFLRLDCMRDNARIRRYYEGLGFEHRGDVLVGGHFDASLYERGV